MNTLGENRVRVDFNVTNDTLVDSIKQKSAELINLINDIPTTFTDAEKNKELARLKSLSMTAYEEAAMWGVKAATAQ